MRQLTISLGTVKAHVHRIYGKLGVESRTQAINRARESHLI
jgi:ATP/maltotriose-dependent transcriptional regulator MalT